MKKFQQVFFLIIFIYALFKFGQFFQHNDDDANDISKISQKRIDSLLNKLRIKEKEYASVLNWLKIDEFKQNEYVVMKNDALFSTADFLNHLKKISEVYTFKTNKNLSQYESINKKDLVIVTASDSNFYYMLQATVASIHQKFPNNKLVIYDLGLDEEMRKKTIEKCKCELRRFNFKFYSKYARHVYDLVTYAWKPFLIQEALSDFSTIMYIDTSIRFKSNQIESILDTIRDTGTMSQLLRGFKLACFTNPKMFNWFNETPKAYELIDSIEANLLFFHTNFLSKLILKAWVICALDKKCIAPRGSHLFNLFTSCSSCGCHRYDQDALSIIYSFFFVFPREETFNPAYAFSDKQKFFEVKRRDPMNYF